MDDIRNRFLRDRVMTATPAQRVALLYDRLVLDLTRAQHAADVAAAAPHLQHASLVLAELSGSLDHAAGGPAAGLASVYQFALREVLTSQLHGFTPALATMTVNLAALRDAWHEIADGDAVPAAPSSEVPVAAGASAGLSLTA